MRRMISLLITALPLLVIQPAISEEQAKVATPPASDYRQLISMPEQARLLMQQDMLSHLSTLNEILGYLASNDLTAAAEVAEKNLGKSSMGKHRATGMGPGRYMTLEMRNIGWGMHDAASEFSNVAKQGNLKDAYSALNKVTGACVACHLSYRTR